MNNVAETPDTRTKRPYRTAQRMRRELIARGIEPWRVSATPTDALDELDATYPPLQLVFDVDAEDAKVREIAPRLAWHRPMALDESPDEYASVLTFLSGKLVEPANVADARTPWDEYVPDGAA